MYAIGVVFDGGCCVIEYDIAEIFHAKRDGVPKIRHSQNRSLLRSNNYRGVEILRTAYDALRPPGGRMSARIAAFCSRQKTGLGLPCRHVENCERY